MMRSSFISSSVRATISSLSPTTLRAQTSHEAHAHKAGYSGTGSNLANTPRYRLRWATTFGATRVGRKERLAAVRQPFEKLSTAIAAQEGYPRASYHRLDCAPVELVDSVKWWRCCRTWC